MVVTLRQALLIASKDTKIFFKDRFAVGFSFLFPFLFVIGFTLALGDVGPDDSPIEFVVASQEADGISLQIIAELQQTVTNVVVEDYETALSDVRTGRLDGFIAFPSDFSKNIATGVPTSLEVVIASGAPPDVNAALRGFADSMSRRFTETAVTASALVRLASMAPAGVVDTDPASVLFEQQSGISFATETVGDIQPIGASNFTLPGYLTMFLFFAAAMSAEAIARERQAGTLERLMSNGARREAIVLGKFSGAAFRGLLQLTVMWTVGILAFRIDLGISPGAVVLISVLMALASAAFGVMLASFVRGVQTATTAGVLVSLILAPLGGCWWPLFITPDWMQTFAKLTPHGWANGGFNKLMLFGAGFGDVTQEMMALAIFGAAFLTIALWRFRLSAI